MPHIAFPEITCECIKATTRRKYNNTGINS